MRGRAFRIALLLLEAVWLNVIVPGHRRGIVALPGESRPACPAQSTSADCCCDMPTDGKSDPAKPAKGDPANHCAICNFAVRLTLPPVIDLRPPPLRLAEELPFPIPESAESVQFVPVRFSRGPPVLAPLV